MRNNNYTRRTTMKKSNVDMLSGSISKGLLALAVPIMIMNVMQNLFNVIDMSALRHFADDMAVGAVGTCGSLIVLCTSLMIGLAAGANVVVAKRIGSGNQESTDRAVMTSLLIAVIGGLIMMVIGIAFAEVFLKLVNCPEALLGRAVLYFRIFFVGIPMQLLYNFCASLLRATGDTKKPMYYLIIGGIVKVAFTVLFLIIFKADVACVAYATIISNIVSSGLAFRALLKSEVVNVNFKEIKIDFEEFKQILFIGVPSGLQSAMYSSANVIIMSVVNAFGADATTGVSIANQFDGILYQIVYAPSLAVIPYVAQNIGAGNLKRVKQTILKGTLITIAFGASFGFLSAFFAEQLSSIMSPTPAVIAYSAQKMIIVSSTYFICGINDVIGGVLKGMGKPIFPTVTTMIFMCVLRFVWVYLVYPLLPQNLTFLYLVWPVGWILSIITLLIVYFPAMSKLQKRLLQKQSV